MSEAFRPATTALRTDGGGNRKRIASDEKYRYCRVAHSVKVEDIDRVDRLTSIREDLGCRMKGDDVRP
jgi:hypothetical protein